MRIYKGVERADGLRVVYETMGEGYTALLTPFERPGIGAEGQGFDWGVPSDGAVRLAEVLLRDNLGMHAVPSGLLAVFTAEVIARLPYQSFTLSSDQIEGWYADLAGTKKTTPRRGTPT